MCFVLSTEVSPAGCVRNVRCVGCVRKVRCVGCVRNVRCVRCVCVSVCRCVLNFDGGY
jgi:hypothetical protein